VSWSNWSRRLVALPLHLIRTLPLLAMVPLFPLWFGTYFVGFRVQLCRTGLPTVPAYRVALGNPERG
jgi:hypothetical protein